MQPIKKQYQLFIVLSGILSLLLFNSWVLFYNFQKVSEQEQWVAHTASVIRELDGLTMNMLNAETGVRGFLLTGEDKFLEPYKTAVLEHSGHIEKLARLVRDNEDQSISAREISAWSKERYEALEGLLKQFERQNGRITNNSQFFEQGRSAMVTFRGLLQKMQDKENELLEKRREQAERSRNYFYWFLAITTLSTLLVIGFTFVQFKRNQDRTVKEAQDQARDAWMKEHVAEAAKIFSGTNSLQEMTKDILHFLSLKFGALALKIYGNEFGKLNIINAYGASAETFNPSREANSLIENAIKRAEAWQVNDIPTDYWKMSSSMGEARPKSLLFLPLQFQQRTIGLIEMATFTPMSSDHMDVLNKLKETIGTGLNAVQSREHLHELLQQTQQQAEELQAQQEELRTNNEELEQQARALETQQQDLNYKNRELELAQTSLQAKAQDLQRSNQYKSEFLAKMSHELRTPLNGLMILSTLLIENKEKNLTEQQKQFAASINTAGNDLLTLINDILDLSKIEARKLSLRSEQFSVGSLLEQLHRMFEPQVHHRGLKFIFDDGEAVRQTLLQTDRQRLEQILRNFLSNAIKFTDKGEISVITTITPDKRLRIDVRDTGIGIPKEKLDVIFEAFEQADGSVSRRYGGTGLGLTISRELANLLGGEIRLSSEDGKGSEFSLIIPLELPSSATFPTPDPVIPRDSVTLTLKESMKENAASLKGMVQEAVKNVDFKKRTILIVEDDDKFRASAAEVASHCGFQPIEVARGDVALSLLNDYTPTAILLDIKLPEISGLGLLEIIKQLPHLRHVPVHMISALDYQHNALRMGALGYLTKPVTIEKIRSALDRIEHMISEKVRKVLLIEDDETQSSAVSNLIAGSDVQVVPVRSGKQAVAEMKNGSYDCIILDLTLPDVSGFDLLSELNSLEISLPPIVIYTGKDLSPQEENYLRRYSESIIIKGARSPERLLDEVNLFLHRVESLLPEEKREMLTHLRSQEKSFDGNTILLADDDMRNVFALTSALESKGLKVKIAKNGLEAIEALDKHPEISLVLMDIMMPKMDGFQAMKKIRENPAWKNLPIIALTAKAMKEDHEKCIEAGANDYLTKPVNLNNLTTVMKVWLSNESF